MDLILDAHPIEYTQQSFYKFNALKYKYKEFGCINKY